MGNKRKSQLTTDIEWHKHLRNIRKKVNYKKSQGRKTNKIKHLTRTHYERIQTVY